MFPPDTGVFRYFNCTSEVFAFRRSINNDVINNDDNYHGLVD